MSLSTEEALNSAIADLVNAKLCLVDAIAEANVQQEIEEIESIACYLEDKLIKLTKNKKTIDKAKAI